MVKFVDHSTFLRKKTPQKLGPFISVFMYLICLVQFHSCTGADKRNQQTLVVKTEQISMSKYAINSPQNMHTNCMNSDSHCQFYLNNKWHSLHFKTSNKKKTKKTACSTQKTSNLFCHFQRNECIVETSIFYSVVCGRRCLHCVNVGQIIIKISSIPPLQWFNHYVFML